ncbi:MAG: site-specific integrase [Candidatus Izemoplasmatales bacterium]|nr:site-specific integrase [Candidatus Izemoplasmatales bacterium]
MRKGEALPLSWSNVDMLEHTTKVSKSYDVTTKRVITPKTSSANQIIPLFPETCKVIDEIQKNGAEIFHFIGKQSITKTFAKRARDYGFLLSLHGLRHYFATQCLEAKIEEKIVQKWLGHTKYEITINTYSHINMGFEEEAIRTLTEFWRKKTH